MSNFVGSLLPKKFHRLISVSRTLGRSYERDARMKQLHPIDLKAKHLSNLTVLPTRSELLQAMPKELVCAEVGVAEGEFSREILDVMKPTRLHLVDLWHPDSSRYAESMRPALDRTRCEIDAGIVEVHRGLSWEQLAKLEDDSLDWVYLDAAHDYDSVSKDLSAVLPKMRDAGIICGHDYTRWSSQGIHRWGVVEAVNMFCLKHNWEFLFLTHETHRHISYALRRMTAPGES